MPLPLIPLLLGGAALVTAGIGAKKGYDAYSDFSRASELNDEAKGIYSKAQSRLEAVREDTQKQLERLGACKLRIYEKSLVPFVENFSKIKNIDFTDPDLQVDPDLIFKETDFKEIQTITLTMANALVGGVVSLGGGALAGIGAFGGAGLLATASTGTAISSLAGVAATNATLAWFGGGALAAGGLGMAGGAVVLGGIVAAPVLAVGGFLMASKAESAKYDAYSNLSKAEGAAEAMETARTAARSILKRSEEIQDVLESVEDQFSDSVADLKDLVSEHTDFKEYSPREQRLVGSCAAFAKTVNNVLQAPLIDNNGAVTEASRKAMRNAREFISKLSHM